MGWNAVVVSFVFAVLLNGAAASITWTTADEHLKSGSLKACAGSDVYLNWTFTLSDGQHEYNIDWTFLGPNLPESDITYIASSSHGHLFDGNGKYDKTTSAGIKIANVNKSDEGNYSVTVVAQSGRQFESYTVDTSVYLHVDEPVEIANGLLHIEYSPGPNGDDIVIKCGNFLHFGNPPANVTWKYDHITQNVRIQSAYVNLSQTLSGEVHKSYNCSVTPDASSVCRTIYGPETFHLSGLDVKLSLIESRLKRLESFHDITGGAVASCATTGCSQSDMADVKAQLANVTSDNDLLERRIQALNDTLHKLHNNDTAGN